MKIGTKLTLALSAPLMGLMAAFGWLWVSRSRVMLERGLADERGEISKVIQAAAEDSVTETTPQTAVELVDRVSGFTRITGLRLFDETGGLAYQSAGLVRAPALPADVLRSVLDRREVNESHLQLDGEPVVAFAFPITGTDGHLVGAVQAFQRENFIAEETGASRHRILVLTIAMIVAASAIVLVVIRSTVSRPIEELAMRFGEVAGGELSARVPIRSSDELGYLARAFNEMCERLETTRHRLIEQEAERRSVEASLRRAERLANVGRLAAGLAHEIGTPLSVIAGRAESLRKKLQGNEPAERNLGIIVGQIERITRTMRRVLDQSRSTENRRVPTAVSEVLDRILELLDHRLARSNTRVRTEYEPGCPQVLADRDRLDELFLNLAMNSLDAMPDGGTLTLRVGEQTRHPPDRPDSEGRYVVAVIEDQGCGIAPGDMQRVFDPFYTTKAVGEGTGLGLSLSRGIAMEHGGWMEIASTPGAGTRVAVVLPVQEQTAASRTPAAGATR